MLTLFQTLSFILSFVWFIIIAQIIISWLVQFEVLNIRQPLVNQIYFGLRKITEPVYAPIRRILPATAGLDFAPVVVIIGLFFLQRLLANNIGMFG